MTLLNLSLYAGSSYDGGTGIIPADLKERLRAFVPSPPALTMAAQDELPEAIAQPRRGYYGKKARPVDQVPLTRRDMEHPAQQDLPAVLRLVERGNVAVSAKTRQATAAAVRRIAAVLYDGHDRRRPQRVPGRAVGLWRLTCRRYWTLGGTHEARRHHGDRVPQLEEW